MVSGERCLVADDGFFTNNMKEMIGGCCVCSDERGWAENPLVYCDGHGCNVAVHQGKQLLFISVGSKQLASGLVSTVLLQGYGALRVVLPPPPVLTKARLESGSVLACKISLFYSPWMLPGIYYKKSCLTDSPYVDLCQKRPSRS